MKLLFTESDFWDKDTTNFKKDLEVVITRSYKKAKKLLPFLSEHVNIVVQPNKYEVVPETGEGGFSRNFELILAFFDPARLNCRQQLIDNISSMIFHELNHVARYAVTEYHEGFLKGCVMEGLATVFEREYGDYGVPLWGKYKATEAKVWLAEIKLLGESVKWNDYMFKHPDGRKWIGYKVGTYIIDQASKNSGKSVLELTSMECEDILKLAKV